MESNEVGAYRFTLKSLLVATAIIAFVLSVLNLLGPANCWTLFVFAYAFAPAIAMIVFHCLQRQPKWFRFSCAGATLILLGTVMILSCESFYGADTVPIVLAGTLIEWPGQFAILLLMRLIYAHTPPSSGDMLIDSTSQNQSRY